MVTLRIIPRRGATLAGLTLALLISACGGSSPGPTAASSPPASAPSPASPAADEPTGTDGSDAPEPEAPQERTLSEGRFEPIGYQGKGTATLVEDAEGNVELRFTKFKVEQGPTLRVYLSSAKAGSSESLYDDDFADLGKLRSFSGDQTYDVPNDAKWQKRESVVIWCEEFSVGFVVAPIDRKA